MNTRWAPFRDAARPAIRRGVLCVIPALAATFAPASPAWSGPDLPSPANSTFPCAIRVLPAPAATNAFDYVVNIRDYSNNPVPHSRVVIDFSACGGDLRVAQVQMDGSTVSCETQSVEQFTDDDGFAVFRVIGAAAGGAYLTHSPPCMTLSHDGIVLGHLQASVFDLDGVGGLTGADLSLWLTDFYSGAVPPTYSARSDYNFVNGACATQELTAGDLAIWFDTFFALGSTYGTPLCP